MDRGQPDRAAGGVRRRRVFYIPGYDPFPPRRYRELYRKEGAEQAAISGYRLALQPKRGHGPAYGWRVTARIDGREVRGRCRGAGLVRHRARRRWTRASSGTYAAAAAHGLGLYRLAARCSRLMRLRKGPMIAALYPVVMLLRSLALAWLAGLGRRGRCWRWRCPGVWAGSRACRSWCGVLRWFRGMDHRLFAYYLMHDYAYSAQARRREPARAGGADGRRSAARSARRWTARCDEVLVVGHSSGAHLAVSILADLIREGLPQRRAGAGVPVAGAGGADGVVPAQGASGCAADLHYLSARDELTWVDVTAPGDGCAFALCDPVAVTRGGAGRASAGRWSMSAAFTPDAERRSAGRRCAGGSSGCISSIFAPSTGPGDYDYFRITAGPMTLAARYAGRAAVEKPHRRAGVGLRQPARMIPPKPAARPDRVSLLALSAAVPRAISCRRSPRGFTAPGWPSSARRSSAAICATTPRWCGWC